LKKSSKKLLIILASACPDRPKTPLALDRHAVQGRLAMTTLGCG
jgi:hypothetical protein